MAAEAKPRRGAPATARAGIVAQQARLSGWGGRVRAGRSPDASGRTCRLEEHMQSRGKGGVHAKRDEMRANRTPRATGTSGLENPELPILGNSVHPGLKTHMHRARAEHRRVPLAFCPVPICLDVQCWPPQAMPLGPVVLAAVDLMVAPVLLQVVLRMPVVLGIVDMTVPTSVQWRAASTHRGAQRSGARYPARPTRWCQSRVATLQHTPRLRTAGPRRNAQRSERWCAKHGSPNS